MRHLPFRVLTAGIFAASPLLAACAEEQAEAGSPATRSEATAASAPAATPVSLARAEFDVQGMDCGGCVIGTRAALKKVDGVQHADAAYDSKTKKGTAWALYDPAKVTPERLMAAIRELGYTPTQVSARS